MKLVLDFLRDLSENNNREWFNANKARYLTVKANIESLAELLINQVSAFEPAASALRPNDCMYRIYRDTRFSLDKTPYKTHIGVFINPHGGKKSHAAGYYLHIEPGASLVAGGAWCPDPDELRGIRTDIYENVDEYIEILSDPEFRKYYDEVGEDCLKTAPKGFPKDWEYIDFLKPRSFTTYTSLSDRQVLSPDFEKLVAERMHALFKFNRFLNYTLDQEL